MPRKVCLGRDLARERNHERGEKERANACHDGIRQQCQQHVNGDIAPQYRRQQEVEIATHREDRNRGRIPGTRFNLESHAADPQ